ncbi:MAG TPA: protein-L-isoaspartate(D-aspartate) O-methyltransferase [Alphaproteobacteria bacterium]|jgi:protein-L-isoaspartate(D-aspartate) O-methyltransferase|nr:protein-L-isoaspartate(D-aspartate) O-methyltransferase [Alphaproteobacteria bacterium]
MLEREQLLGEIDSDAQETARLTGRAQLSPRVRAALLRVRRDAFVPEAERRLAYLNTALPIGQGQTISQPFVVAIMTELLDLAPTDRVLEIGTGSGYQAAILAELAAEVLTIEVIASLGKAAAERLAAMGYKNVEVRIADGNEGWPERAPFDAIIVTAAAPQVPPALLEQLKPGGRMVIPIGSWPNGQILTRLAKAPDGAITRSEHLPVAFVPFVIGGSKGTERGRMR